MSNTTNFLNQIKQGAIAGWHKYGILPSVTGAQAALESAWGTSQLSLSPNNNLFGIKGSYNGQSVNFPTWEVINGQNVTVNAAFRKYPDWNTSVEDHGSFFHDNSRYHGLIGLRDYKEQARAIKAAGYATDPDYPNKLISTIEYNNLQLWDNEAFGLGANGLDPHRNFSIEISPFNESEALDRLNEFRKVFPSYTSHIIQLENKTQYKIVVQPFTYLEVNAKHVEIKSKFPNWSMKVAELTDVSQRKAVVVAPYTGEEAAEKYLQMKKEKPGVIMDLENH